MSEVEVMHGWQMPIGHREYQSVAPDGAPESGAEPSPGLPWESATRPDVERGLSEADRGVHPEMRRAIVAEAERITAQAASVMHISQAGLSLIESFEGFSPVQYNDGTGVMTIGYGTTSADIYPLPRSVTRAQAQLILARELAEKYEPAVRSIGVALTQHQFDALCSFVYNLGPGAVGPAWTVGRLLRERNYTAAADALLQYDVAGGRVLAGLERRRQAERALFLEPMPAAPDPHHLLYFPTNTWILDGKRIPERETVAEWWKLIGEKEKNLARLRVLQADVVLLRRRVWAVAHHDHPVSWGTDHRGMRWQELEAISKVHL